MTQPDQAQPGQVAPRRSRWRLRFSLGTLFLAVAAVAVALAWFTRADRFYDLPQVYGFQLAATDGRPLRGGVAFVLQHRFMPQHRRLQFVIFIDLQPDQSRDRLPENLEMKHVGRYALAQYGNCLHLSIPDVQTKYGPGWSMCVDKGTFGTGAVHEIGDMREPDSDQWLTIVGGGFALVPHESAVALTWDQLLHFINDPTIDRWNAEAVQRWKDGQS